jgi:secreted trypsin-like serine protease
MKPTVFRAICAGVLALGGAAAMAQSDVTPFFSESGKKGNNPYSFAESGKKAERSAQEDAAGSKVIGGEISAEGAWPWQVALVASSMPVSTDSQFCGGSLVLDQWVLTAAHCVRWMDDQGESFDLLPQEISVLAGTNTLDGSGEMVPIEQIFVHPSYTVDQLDYDIALIKLARAPNVPYQTIEVPDAEFGSILKQPGITTIVTGWGLQNGGRPSPQLQEAQIQMLDSEQCNTAMMEARAEEAVTGFVYAAQVLALGEEQAVGLWEEMIGMAPVPVTENMICSGTFEGGKTSCNGDSGGPLVVPLEDGSYIQAGIVSWGLSSTSGHGCEERAMFSVYTDVSAFVPWLNEVIGANP